MAHDILIVDDEPDIRALVQGILSDEGYATREAANSDAALAAFRARRPSLVILDIWLQGSRLDGLGILRAMHREEPQVPCVMMSGHGTIETAVQAIQQGAYDFIEKPFQSDRLLLVVQRALEAARLRREVSELRLRAGAETELIGHSTLTAQLRAAGHTVLESDSGPDGLLQFGRHKPDLVLLDVEMPGEDGYWAARQMRAAEAGDWTPIIFLSSRDQDQDLWQGIESGGDDYLVRPVSTTVLHAKLRAMQRLRRMQSRLLELSDELRASKILASRAAGHPKISFVWDSVVEEILGGDRVTGLRLANLKSSERAVLPTDGVFLAIGHSPNTRIFAGQLDLTEAGYIRLRERSVTSVEGVFAAGDAHDGTYRQTVTAAGFGAMAAIDADRWLREQRA